MEQVEISALPAPADLLDAARINANARSAAGLWFPACAHVLDPLEIVKAFMAAATQRGAIFSRADAKELRPRAGGVYVGAKRRTSTSKSSVVCPGGLSD